MITNEPHEPFVPVRVIRLVNDNLKNNINMAKIELNHMFVKMSGKLCSTDGTYIAYNKQTGKMYQAIRHRNDAPEPPTEDQQEVRTTFASKAKAASEWWQANKPLVDNEGTVTREASEDYNKVIKAYKAQRRFGNPYSYLRSLVADDLTITIGGTTTTTTPDNKDEL